MLKSKSAGSTSNAVPKKHTSAGQYKSNLVMRIEKGEENSREMSLKASGWPLQRRLSEASETSRTSIGPRDKLDRPFSPSQESSDASGWYMTDLQILVVRDSPPPDPWETTAL